MNEFHHHHHLPGFLTHRRYDDMCQLFSLHLLASSVRQSPGTVPVRWFCFLLLLFFSFASLRIIWGHRRYCEIVSVRVPQNNNIWYVVRRSLVRIHLATFCSIFFLFVVFVCCSAKRCTARTHIIYCRPRPMPCHRSSATHTHTYTVRENWGRQNRTICHRFVHAVCT